MRTPPRLVKREPGLPSFVQDKTPDSKIPIFLFRVDAHLSHFFLPSSQRTPPAQVTPFLRLSAVAPINNFGFLHRTMSLLRINDRILPLYLALRCKKQLSLCLTVITTFTLEGVCFTCVKRCTWFFSVTPQPPRILPSRPFVKIQTHAPCTEVSPLPRDSGVFKFL